MNGKIWTFLFLFTAQFLILGDALSAPRIRKVLCNVFQVAIIGSRAHIECHYKASNTSTDGTSFDLNKSSDHPVFFALNVSDPKASLMISLAAQFKIDADNDTRIRNYSKWNFIEIHYDANDLSGDKFGCQIADCRKPISLLAHANISKGD